jgi:6-phosphogluconolactonase (cycloisomerase 2 family)
MKFWNFRKSLLMAALSAAVIFGFTSCTQSFTVGYLFITGTVTGSPAGSDGIVSGYKIDNNTGKLTAIHGLPVGSGGANPSRAVLLSGGRFLYVLNMGVNKLGTDCSTVTTDQLVSDYADYECAGANITLFTIGGNGILTQEGQYPTQGINPYRLIPDSSGGFLFALEKSAPLNSDAQFACQAITQYNYCGDVTAFSINQTTGRLSTIENAQLTANSSGTPLTYFPIPENPIDFTFASGYLMTVAAPTYTTGNVAFPYTYNTGNGQLTLNSNSIGTYVLTNGDGTPVEAATNIVYAASYVYVLDNESVFDATDSTTYPSQILPYTVNGGALVSQTGGAVPNDSTLSDPINLMVESKDKFLFVISDAPGCPICGDDPNGGITQYVFDPASHQLLLNSPTTTGTGSQPQCILEDPTNQYIYTANNDSTVNGHVLDPNTGVLSPLRGNASVSTYTLGGPATWCVVTGRTH